MRINGISPVSCKANINSKLLKNPKNMTVPLKDGNEATLTVADNYIGTVVKKGDKVIKKTGLMIEQGVSSRFLWSYYEQLQKNVKAGFDLFDEFCKTILS